jgi:hypothetical protein
MDNLTPITREEMLMNDEPLTPITREEKILAGEDLTPVTRREYFLKKYRHVGGDVMVEGLEVTANGTYTAPEGKAYSPVNVNVPMPENAYLLKEASGSLVSFNDGADLPMPSFICNIDAQQDLHGFDAPWVGGAGKNKLPMTVEGIKAANNNWGSSWSGNTLVTRGIAIDLLTDSGNNLIGIKFNGTSSGQFIFNFTGTTTPYVVNTYGEMKFNGFDGRTSPSQYCNIIMYSNDGAQWANEAYQAGGDDRVILSNYDYVSIGFLIRSGQTLNNVVVRPMLRLSTETDPTFAPYSNICPISGHTGVNAKVRGKNLYNNEVGTLTTNGITFTKNADGSIQTSGTATSNAYYNMSNRILPKDTYIVSGCPSGGAEDKYKISVYNATSSQPIGGSDIGNGFHFTADGESEYRLFIRIINGQNMEGFTFYPMIRLATETDSTYEPYNPNSQTIQVSWQTEAGEVYGGEVDLVSGVLTVTDGYIASYDGEILPSTWISDSDVYAEETTPTTGAEVVYKLAEAQTYQLTPTQIKSLLGNNNAWCDTGDVDIEYFGKEVTG